MRSIVWLASYPKSGNTWLRIFLENLLSASETACSINNLSATHMSCSLDLFLNECPWNISLMTQDEIDNLRPKIYSNISQQSKDLKFFKTHSGYFYNTSGKPVFPDEATRSAIYLVRNPIDICISYAYHRGHIDFDSIIKDMGNPEACLFSIPGTSSRQLRQKILSWSMNVKSWISEKSFPVLVLRYEDILNNPHDSFSKVVNHLKLEKNKDAIQKAIKNSSFEELQRQEHLYSFKEKPGKAQAFFRAAKKGEGRATLSSKQIETIISDHGNVMSEFDYL
ncbi:MAG: sulfotransferase domain-containing protein [Candidatus Riflebacteria bacterium]|nr:sulfotransferase domain-containing protein [Candidatus Riflebacteria bacterium]